MLPVPAAFRPLLPGHGLRRGSTVTVSRSASLALALVARASADGSWVAAVGLPDLGVVAAAESGLTLERLALVPHPWPRAWVTVVAALLDAIDVVLVRPPPGLRAADARRLSARAWERGAVLVSLGAWSEPADLRLAVTASQWQGLGQGHGSLASSGVARCPTCQATWQLSPRPCQRCVLAQRVHQLLGEEDGQVRTDLAPLRHALTGVERPHTALTWLARPAVRAILAEISRDHRPLTYPTLDELPAGKTLDHLRSVLVAGALPYRDERLAKLERWTAGAIEARADPADRRVLHGYAVWHHLRRLRRRLVGTHATHLQTLNVRCHAPRRRTSWTGLPARAAPWRPAPRPTWTAGPPTPRPAIEARLAISCAGPWPTVTPAG
jgi:hypothetical protein